MATAYAGRLLAAMGAEVVMLEPIQGTVLRNAPPFLQETGESALFAYLAAGKHSLVSDALAPEWPGLLDKALQSVDIFLDDTPIHERKALGLNEEAIRERFPKLVHVSVLPFGSAGAGACMTYTHGLPFPISSLSFAVAGPGAHGSWALDRARRGVGAIGDGGRRGGVWGGGGVTLVWDGDCSGGGARSPS